ncbi:hypothetical protein CUMW_170710 [Citrus unshiu]|uniref:Uncharacterized protein n=1 Tax=Citrus unshiu TaxID=55188 RepID=A0A2H5PVC5_CITUN|nr:hypothetical protein CUMW_170710 [Citrus unshiu]GAY56291.1 hypothetical protein CUMW_170710 [Citrus unshiu]GAY56292.1 hypothetical protein CUMW_170710 [Citrus unshiu]
MKRYRLKGRKKKHHHNNNNNIKRRRLNGFQIPSPATTSADPFRTTIRGKKRRARSDELDRRGFSDLEVIDSRI